MKAAGLDFDLTFTSFQSRAIKTLNLALEAMGRLWLPTEKSWKLNERHYGGLTGLDKAETAALHGDDQVKIWRRSFDIPPPLPEEGSAYDLSKDLRYHGIPIPQTESLKDTIARVLPYWDGRIAPELKAGKRVLIAAHGNSLRALEKHLSGISDADITGLEIPTGQPIVYQLDADLKPGRTLLSERADGQVTNVIPAKAGMTCLPYAASVSASTAYSAAAEASAAAFSPSASGTT